MESRVSEVRRVSFLKVPMDILPETAVETVFRTMSEDGNRHQVVLINFFDFMKAKRNKTYRKMLEEASLVIPTAKSLSSGFRFLNKEDLPRYRPFDFAIRVLGVMEKYNKTLYLLGGKQNALQSVFGNMKTSFPGLNIVGRYRGFYSQNIEEDIITAIKKASPSFLLAGDGLKGRGLWINRNIQSFNPGIFFWNEECFSIFSGRKHKGSRKSWENGTEVFYEVLRNPLKVFRIFIRLYYSLTLLAYRISGKKLQ